MLTFITSCFFFHHARQIITDLKLWPECKIKSRGEEKKRRNNRKCVINAVLIMLKTFLKKSLNWLSLKLSNCIYNIFNISVHVSCVKWLKFYILYFIVYANDSMATYFHLQINLPRVSNKPFTFGCILKKIMWIRGILVDLNNLIPLVSERSIIYNACITND